MNFTIKPYGEEHIPLVKAFNQRLRGKGDQHRFPESNIPAWLPKHPENRLYQEYYVIGDDDAIRGGYILKHQDFYFKGKTIHIANMQLPISEGIIDPRFMLVAAVIARNAIEQAPVMYSLGLGGFSEPITKLFQAMRWSMLSIPFFFKVLNCGNFFRKNAYLRQTVLWRMLMDIGAYSGMGSISLHSLQYLRQRHLETDHVLTNDVSEGDADIDAVWEHVKDRYALIAVRDKRTVDTLYPVSEKRFRRIKVYAGGKCIGWIVTLCTQMTTHKQFGSLCVGSIVDCLSHPDDALRIIHVGAADLAKQGADILVANHSHHAWGWAFEKNGFLRGPSNFIFGASVELSRMLKERDASLNEIFFMRGDGDGPINL